MGDRILGLGCDLVEVSRFETLLSRGLGVQAPIVQRVLTLDEQKEFERRYALVAYRGVLYLSSRFAAKEAFSKALGSGVGACFSFQDVSVLNDELGRPVLKYSEKFEAWMLEHQAKAQVSISDEGAYALATVILYETQ